MAVSSTATSPSRSSAARLAAAPPRVVIVGNPSSRRVCRLQGADRHPVVRRRPRRPGARTDAEPGVRPARGPLSSCNYGCAYCPFAKHRETAAELAEDRRAVERFVAWVAERTGDLDRRGVRFSVDHAPSRHRGGEGLLDELDGRRGTGVGHARCGAAQGRAGGAEFRPRAAGPAVQRRPANQDGSTPLMAGNPWISLATRGGIPENRAQSRGEGAPHNRIPQDISQAGDPAFQAGSPSDLDFINPMVANE
jgi:hypothetical protein